MHFKDLHADPQHKSKTMNTGGQGVPVKTVVLVSFPFYDLQKK